MMFVLLSLSQDGTHNRACKHWTSSGEIPLAELGSQSSPSGENPISGATNHGKTMSGKNPSSRVGQNG